MAAPTLIMQARIPLWAQYALKTVRILRSACVPIPVKPLCDYVAREIAEYRWGDEGPWFTMRTWNRVIAMMKAR